MLTTAPRVPANPVWLSAFSGQGGGADIHLHERGLAGAETIRAICAQVEERRIRGKVTISHAFVLGDNGGVDAVSTSCSRGRHRTVAPLPSTILS